MRTLPHPTLGRTPSRKTGWLAGLPVRQLGGGLVNPRAPMSIRQRPLMTSGAEVQAVLLELWTSRRRSDSETKGASEGWCAAAMYSFLPQLNPEDIVAGQYRSKRAASLARRTGLDLPRSRPQYQQPSVVLKGLVHSGDAESAGNGDGRTPVLAEGEFAPSIVQIFSCRAHRQARGPVGYIID